VGTHRPPGFAGGRGTRGRRGEGPLLVVVGDCVVLGARRIAGRRGAGRRQGGRGGCVAAGALLLFPRGVGVGEPGTGHVVPAAGVRVQQALQRGGEAADETVGALSVCLDQSTLKVLVAACALALQEVEQAVGGGALQGVAAGRLVQDAGRVA